MALAYTVKLKTWVRQVMLLIVVPELRLQVGSRQHDILTPLTCAVYTFLSS